MANNKQVRRSRAHPIKQAVRSPKYRMRVERNKKHYTRKGRQNKLPDLVKHLMPVYQSAARFFATLFGCS